MRQFCTIAANAFMELIRQPVFLLMMTASVLFELFLAVPYYFAFGDEPKLVKNSTLAVMLMSGLVGAVLSASSSLAREIRTGTVLAVLSKPVGRAQFLLAKYAGLAAALTVMTYVNLIGVLVASRMAFDAYGRTDMAALGIFAAGLTLAYALAGFSNFFLRRPFVGDAVLVVVVFATLAAFVIFQFTTQMESLSTPAHVDWDLVPPGILILFALWILAALALACSTRLDTIPTLAVCSAFFLLGLMSDYFYWKAGGRTEGGGPWWASTLYTVIPNWQLLWFADALNMGKSTFHWAYVGKAFVYAVAYAGAALAVGTALFEERELS
ncbi:MAG: ABC transporter permease subunit [Verrucomicrobiota bacterium]|jgi:ABC-type transport system involved in multi-copper enzyme maturation permease subunit